MRGGTAVARLHPVNDFISIHPPRAGRDEGVGAHIISDELFQSTRPVRGGTAPTISHTARFTFQSTRPVRGGTRNTSGLRNQSKISIHPPRAGRDSNFRSKANPLYISIHPPRAGRDKVHIQHPQNHKISIHPPRAGRDPWFCYLVSNSSHFNPPAPCGAGPIQQRKTTADR